MKVIKPGNTMGGDWVAKTICTGKGNGGHGCGAELEVSRSDLFRTYNSCMGRDETHFITFMCPCCGEFTDIYDTDGYRDPVFPSNLSYRDFPHPSDFQRKEAKRRLREGPEYTPPHLIED